MTLEMVGDYAILKDLGQGPFGSIYLAEHRFLKRSFVLKALPEALCSDPEFLRRFEEQVGRIAALEHLAILPIHTLIYAEGRYFLVFSAHGDAVCLTDYKRMTEEEVGRVIAPIASALDAAHEAGVIHGGLQLSNIWISPGERVLLSDFGLTGWFGPAYILLKLCEDILKSHFARSYAFLAPEQRTAGEVSSKVDTYAFGVLVYYLLLGKIPEGHFEWPSQALPSLQKQWDGLISRCLQVDPAQRPERLQPLLAECLTPPAIQQMSFDFPKPLLRPQEIERPEYIEDPSTQLQRDTNVSHYVPKKEEGALIEPLLTEMVIIPSGTYLRGSGEGARDEMPRHPVRISRFAIDIHPVTNEQFVRFLEVMGGEKDSNNNDIIRLRDSRIKRNAGKLLIEFGYAKHPVVGVTWYGAVAYAKWVGKRLPSEAEWEVAALGGQEHVLYPTGMEMERTQANFFGSDTTAIMSYPPNSSGLYDMAGNVYEWCHDWYAYNYYEASSLEPNDPRGPAQGVYRVLRGGCWKSLKEDLRCSHRHRNNPGAVNGTYGFRCAADVSL